MPWEETENEIRHRIKDPMLFQEGSFVTKEFQAEPKIYAVMGKLKGEDTMSVQSVRFAMPDWSMEDAKKWMSEHMELKKSMWGMWGMCGWTEMGDEIRYGVLPVDLFEDQYKEGALEVREALDAGKLYYLQIGKLKGNNDQRVISMMFPKAYWTMQTAKNFVDKNQTDLVSGKILKAEADMVEFVKQASLEPQSFTWLVKSFTEDEIKGYLAAKNYDVTNLKKSADRWRIEMRPESDFQKGSIRDIQVRDGFVMTVGLLKKDISKAEVSKRVPDRFMIPADRLSYLEDVDIQEVTLTKAPIVGKMAEFTVIKAMTDETQSYQTVVPILKVNDEKQQVSAYALVPDLPDWQGDIVTKAEVEKAAHRFMRNLAHRNHLGQGTGHEHGAFEGIGYPIESFLDTDGIHGVPGGWFLTTQITKGEVWNDVKAGRIVGYSVGGSGRRRKANLEGLTKSEPSVEEQGIFQKFLSWFRKSDAGQAAPVTPPVPQTQQLEEVPNMATQVDVTKYYTPEEIQKAKERGIDLENATAGFEQFMKAVGMNFDWRGIGAMTLSFADAAKKGEFGMFPTAGAGTVLKSQGDEVDQIAQAVMQMANQQQQLLAAVEQIQKSRGFRQSNPGMPWVQPQQVHPEPQEFALNQINFGARDAATVLKANGFLG